MRQIGKQSCFECAAASSRSLPVNSAAELSAHSLSSSAVSSRNSDLQSQAGAELHVAKLESEEEELEAEEAEEAELEAQAAAELDALEEEFEAEEAKIEAQAAAELDAEEAELEAEEAEEAELEAQAAAELDALEEEFEAEEAETALESGARGAKRDTEDVVKTKSRRTQRDGAIGGFTPASGCADSSAEARACFQWLSNALGVVIRNVGVGDVVCSGHGRVLAAGSIDALAASVLFCEDERSERQTCFEQRPQHQLRKDERLRTQAGSNAECRKCVVVWSREWHAIEAGAEDASTSSAPSQFAMSTRDAVLSRAHATLGFNADAAAKVAGILRRFARHPQRQPSVDASRSQTRIQKNGPLPASRAVAGQKRART